MEINKVQNFIDSINLEEFLDVMIEMSVSPIYSYIVESNGVKPSNGNLVDFISEKISNKTGESIEECKNIFSEYLEMYNEDYRAILNNYNFIEIDDLIEIKEPDMKSIYFIKNDEFNNITLCIYSKQDNMFVPLASTDLELFN